MSLKVWLPLNGTLENKGYSNITITNNGATVDASGKIGSCYAFNGSTGYIALSGTQLFNIFTGGTQQFSIAMWVYHADATRAILFGDYSTSGAINFNIELSTSHGARFYWNASPDVYPSNAVVAASAWTHLVLTYDGTKVQSYINGVAKGTWTGTLGAKNKTSGEFRLGRDNRSDTTAFNGKMNDFRIYDHALSAAEVHEISQGLVLHYKLNDNVGFTDLIARNIQPTIYNNHNNTNMPSTLVKNGAYNGDIIWRETCTPTDNSLNSIKTTLHSHGIYKWDQTFKANTKYVFWIYYKPISHSDTICGGTASNIGGWTEIPPVQVGGGWYRVGQYRNGTVTADKTDSIFVSFKVPSATTGTAIIIDWASPHLLEGTTEIPLYDYPTTIIEDNSGYNHNGIITGTVTSISDTPRYKRSIHLSATNQYITCGAITTAGFANSYTFAWWGKSNTYNGVMHWGFSDGIRLNGIYNGILWNTGDSANNPLYVPGTTTQVTAPTSNVWHHFAMVGNGSTCQVYQDGVLWAQAKTYKAISGTIIYINGWNTKTEYKLTDLSMSDFRIYATALSAADIKTLYEVGAKIDNKGNIHTHEYLEDTKESINKSGIISTRHCSEFFPNLHYDKIIYKEPDGSLWIRIAHHNNPGAIRFASTDTFATGVYVNEDCWYDIEQNAINLSAYEFMVQQALTAGATNTKYRWIQSISPVGAVYDNVKPAAVTRITTSGYTDGTFGGLFIGGHGSTRARIANANSGDWFGSFGSWTLYQNGTPGYPNTVVTTGYMDLYLRIDNLDLNMGAKILKNSGINANTLIEF